VEAVLSWLDQNWFGVVQTLGIVGSIWLAIATLRRDARARRVADHLTLAGQHRELWSDVHRRPELARILHTEVDLVAHSVSVAEEEFLNLVIVHFNTGWLLAKENAILTLDVLATDARSFFALPIPRTVWDSTKHARDPEFVHFIQNALATKARKSFARSRSYRR
jgi:hypothetical protein